MTRSTGSIKQLETFGTPGWITSHLQGRRVEAAYKDGIWLIIRMTDGHEFKIGWQDSHGNQVKGEPFLENLDVKFTLTPGLFRGQAG